MAEKTTKVMLLMSPQEKAALTEIARRNGISMAEAVRRMIIRSAARYGIPAKATA